MESFQQGNIHKRNVLTLFWKTENSKFWIDPVKEFNFYATILHYSQTGLWKNKIQNHFLPTHLFKFGHGNANSGMQANTWWSLYLSGNFSTILPAEGLLLSLDGMTSHQNSKSFSEFLKKKRKKWKEIDGKTHFAKLNLSIYLILEFITQI